MLAWALDGNLSLSAFQRDSRLPVEVKKINNPAWR
jgi:hypothetical protein